MKPRAPLLVPYREVRHDQPDDCLHYESVAIRGAEMDWTIPAHRHEGLHQFQLLQNGSVRGSIDGREFEAGGPALLMLAPGSVHALTYSPEAVGHQVTVPTATLQRLLGGSELVDTGLGASFVIAAPGDPATSIAVFEEVAREFRSREPGRVHVLLALATLIATRFVRERGVQFEHERRGVRDALVQRFLKLVEQHYTEHLPLDFYARQLAVTPDHLSRSCRKVSRMSALEIIHERLMLEARRLLAYTPMPVAGVADQLGYADAAYFSKFFARSVGHTPTTYRTLVARGVQGAVAMPSHASAGAAPPPSAASEA